MSWFDAAAALLCSTTITTTSTFYPSSSKGRRCVRNLIHFLLLSALFLSTSRACHIIQRPLLPSMARVYADVNQHMPRAYWDYDSVNISWGVLENYEVVRKIGAPARMLTAAP
jgi:casein kinase II subunit alpha